MAPSASRTMYWLCRERMDERLGELGRKQLDLVRDGNGRSGNEVAVSMSSITRVRRKDAGVGRRVADAIMLSLWPEDERPFAERIADYGGEITAAAGRPDVLDAVPNSGDSGVRRAGSRKDGERVAGQDGRAATPEVVEVRIKEFFVLGCGVGNRLNLLPVPPRAGADKDLEDFLHVLAEVIPSSMPKCAEIRRVAGVLNSGNGGEPEREVVVSALESYSRAMSSVTGIVRSHATREQQRWYTLGRLLLELTTSSFLGGDVEESADALELHVETSDVPAFLGKKVLELVRAVRTGVDKADVVERANRLSSTILRVL